MDDLTKEQKIKLIALDRAIQAHSGADYNEDGSPIVKCEKIIEAAKKFETYLKDDGANKNG